MKTKILLLTTALFLSGMICGQIIHVPGDQPTIQDGINFASDGDTVLVAEDTYFENIRFFGKAITVASEFIMDVDTSHISNTIINGSQPINPDMGSVVIFMNGEDTTSILNGFTLTAGTGLEIAGQRMGGGIACYQSGAQILNNKIINNEISYAGMTPGGGICNYIDNGETWIIIENNTISGNGCISTNDQAFGGGIAVGTHARIVNNSIYNNHCEAPASNGLTGGGGLYIESSSLPDSVIVKSNEIFDNTLESYYCYGAGIYIFKSFLYLSDNLINTNTNIGTYCYGSAILIREIDGEITIENNLVSENTHQSLTVGAATIMLWSVLDWQSKVNIRHNTINNNTASGANRFGSAIFLRNLENFLVVIDGNVIKGNQGFSGSGLWVRSSFNYKLTNNVFAENDVTDFGGAIFNNIATSDKDDIYLFPGKPTQKAINLRGNRYFHPLIANNTFVGNHSGNLGGAVYLASNYDSLCPVFINNIFYDNTADNMDYDVHHSGDEELLFSNNNIGLNRIFGNWGGTGNIDGDPGFIDTLFHIDASSPCCHAGIDSVHHYEKWYSCPVTDFEGDSRPMPFTCMPDIGADEVDETVGLHDLTVQSSEFEVQSFPNPFSNTTTIQFTLPDAGFVNLEICDITGKKIKILQSGFLQAGEQSFVWDAEGLKGGVYFLRLQTNGISETRKLLLLK